MDGRARSRGLDRVCRACLGGFFGAVIAVVPLAATAQDAPQIEDAPAPPEYAEAIQEAVGHYSAGRWRQAQKAFARAHALQPSARTYRGLGLSAFYLDEL